MSPEQNSSPLMNSVRTPHGSRSHLPGRALRAASSLQSDLQGRAQRVPTRPFRTRHSAFLRTPHSKKWTSVGRRAPSHPERLARLCKNPASNVPSLAPACQRLSSKVRSPMFLRRTTTFNIKSHVFLCRNLTFNLKSGVLPGQTNPYKRPGRLQAGCPAAAG